MRISTIIFLSTLLTLARPVTADEAEKPVGPDSVFGDHFWAGDMVALEGETLLHTDTNGSQIRLRLWAVDAPNMDAIPWGPSARAAIDKIFTMYDLDDLTCNQITIGADQWPIVICYWPNQTIKLYAGMRWNSLNAAIIAAGWATLDREMVASTRFLEYDAIRGLRPFEWHLRLAEDSARIRNAGMWRDYEPIK